MVTCQSNIGPTMTLCRSAQRASEMIVGYLLLSVALTRSPM
jgi:hypothetical protein